MRWDSISGRARRAPGRAARGAKFAGTIVLLIAVDLALRWGRLPRIAGLLGCPLALTGSAETEGRVDRRAAAPTVTEIRHLRDLDRALRWLTGLDTCLRRALVSGFYLRRMRPVLRIGVAKSGEVVTAHAWIEIDGAAVRAADPGGYRVLRRPPGPNGQVAA